MTFLNPIFLWLLPLSLLPIFFHLFFKVKTKKQKFSTLMFFKKIDPYMRARRQIKEWLTLLLRVLSIMFLLLFLSKPVWQQIGKSSNIGVLIIIDNSASMSVIGNDDKTKLQHAIETANFIISGLGERDYAGVLLTVQDVMIPIPNGLTTDKELIKNSINKIVATEASGLIGNCLSKAFELLETCHTSSYEIHIISDLQENEYDKMPFDYKPLKVSTSVIIQIGRASCRERV